MAAGDAVVKGSAEFTEQPRQMRYDSKTGWRHVRVFHGPYDDTKLEALCETLKATCDPIEVTKGWPTIVNAAITVADFDGNESTDFDYDTQTEWSLESYDLQKALGTHGKFQSSGASPLGLAAIDADLKAGTAYSKDYSALYAEGATSNYNNYAKLRGGGTDNWTTFGYVLRRSVDYPFWSNFLDAKQFQGVDHGKIISWAQIGVPSSAKVVQPWVHIYTQTAMGMPAAAFKGGDNPGWGDWYINEWMVKPPSITVLRKGRDRRRQYRQEYLGAIQWSGTLYDGGTGVP